MMILDRAFVEGDEQQDLQPRGKSTFKLMHLQLNINPLSSWTLQLTMVVSSDVQFLAI